MRFKNQKKSQIPTQFAFLPPRAEAVCNATAPQFRSRKLTCLAIVCVAVQGCSTNIPLTRANSDVKSLAPLPVQEPGTGDNRTNSARIKTSQTTGNHNVIFTCLERYYNVQASSRAHGPCLQHGNNCLPLKDERDINKGDPWIARSVEHLMSDNYISEIDNIEPSKDSDPGRVRSESIFRATYGQDKAAIRAQLEEVNFMDQMIRVHRRIVLPLRRVAERLNQLLSEEPTFHPYLKNLGGAFQWRVIAGTERLSAHSFGIAIDINPHKSNYWRWQKSPEPYRNSIPMPLVVAFEEEGFIWGGRWYHYDTMHFEYRPEFFDPDCRWRSLSKK